MIDSELPQNGLFLKLKKNAVHELPLYATSLDQVEWMFKQLDLRYGNPSNDKPKKNGQQTLRFIFKHLSYYKQSTCEEIAKKEYDDNVQTKRKLKSITDDVRKFIQNNLLWPQLVHEDGVKQVRNHPIQRYSLTPVGILYALYLFANLRLDVREIRIGEEYQKIDLKFIRSLAKEYSNVLPKVFGRFEIFEKVIGDEFETILTSPLRLMFTQPDPWTVKDEDVMLAEYAMHDFWSSDLTKNGPHDLIVEQISLVFYANLQRVIQEILGDRHFQEFIKNPFEEKSSDQKQNEESQEFYNQLPKIAKQKWIETIAEDKKLKKWYQDFVKMAVMSKKRELDTLKRYQKVSFLKNI